MRAKLFCKYGELKGKEFEIREEATIGRSSRNKIVLPHHGISKQHARIFLDQKEGIFCLEDLNSSNGTRLDNIRVRGVERLGHLHVITFSRSVEFIFQDLKLCENRYPRNLPAADPGGHGEATSIESIPPAVPIGLENRSSKAGQAGPHTVAEELPPGLPSVAVFKKDPPAKKTEEKR